MVFTLTIKCENAAFSSDDAAGPAIGPEVARILRRLAPLVEAYEAPEAGWAQPLADANGNNVGRAEFTA